MNIEVNTNGVSTPGTGSQEPSRDGNGIDKPTKKHRRVVAACDECRNKKIRCDSSRPVCGPCRKRSGPSSVCTWGVRRVRSGGVSKEELNRLKQRINELENGRKYAVSQGKIPTREDSCTPASTHPPDRGGDNGTESSAMMGLMEDEHQTYSRQYSDSSAKSFVNQIKSVMNGHPSPSDSQTTCSPKRTLVRKPPKRRILHAEHLQNYVLPSRQRADHLLSTYWRLVDTLYPFLDAVQVESFYQRLWTGEELGDDGPIFICLLNVIFSIASKLDPETEPQERTRLAEVFYQRAREFLDFDLLQHRSILTIQCFLLLGQYLQSTNDPQQCWIFVGWAIRIAQSLGLDLPSTSAEADCPQEREVLRRVWYGCVLMDRTLSMTYGRPAMISPEAAASVPRPAAHSENHVCRCFTELCSPDSNETSPHFYIETLKLYELMSETLLTLYNLSSQEQSTHDTGPAWFRSLSAGDIGNVLNIDKNLWSWSQELPIHLRYDPDALKSTTHQRQTNILWLRHHHIRLLLFRPVLSRFSSPNEAHQPSKSLEEDLSREIALQCSVSCVRTALETIEFFEAAMAGKEINELDAMLPAWWYSIFYIYSAATVLVAARLHRAIVDKVSEKAILSGWHGVMRLFKHFSSHGKYATRCAAAVSVLFEQVPPRRSDNQQLSPRWQNSRPQFAKRLPQQQGGGQDMRSSVNFQARSPRVISWEESITTPRSTRSENTAVLDHPTGSTTSVMEVESGAAATDDGIFRSGNSYRSMSDKDSPNIIDYSSVMALINSAGIEFDLAGMSWLTSHPSQFY